MTYSLPSMRTQLRADLSRFFSERIFRVAAEKPVASISVNVAERAAVELDNHFVYLRSAWS